MNTPFGQICLLILAGVAVHLTYLAVNYLLSRYAFRLDSYNLRAVLIMASQKTLPVSVTIISYFPATLGGERVSKGLLTVPCIVGHVSQLFIDAFLAGRFAARDATAKLSLAGDASSRGSAAANSSGRGHASVAHSSVQEAIASSHTSEVQGLLYQLAL